jgi:hypothetical protein
MKKAILVYVYLLFVAALCFPQNDNDRTLSTFFGFSIMPYTIWGSHYDDFQDASNFVYDFDPGVFYILEFDLKHKSGIEMAVSLDVDNNRIEKLSNIIGHLGFKRISTRVSFGDLNGTAYWKGVPVPYQSPSVELDTKYFQLDLLFNAWDVAYFGLCYTSYDLPVIIDSFSLREMYVPNNMYNNIAGIYDIISFRGYGISAYMDTLNGAAKYKKNGLGIWINFGTELTFGPFEISDEALEKSKKYREETDNVALELGNTGSFMAGNYYLTVGPYYLKNSKLSTYGIGIGYNIWGRMIMMGVYGGESGIIQYLYRHGFIIKAVFSY